MSDLIKTLEVVKSGVWRLVVCQYVPTPQGVATFDYDENGFALSLQKYQGGAWCIDTEASDVFDIKRTLDVYALDFPAAISEALAAALVSFPDFPADAVAQNVFRSVDPALPLVPVGVAASGGSLSVSSDVQSDGDSVSSVAPLSVDARQTDPDWAGVVMSIGDDWRLAINGPSDRYLLQKRSVTEHGEKWIGPSSKYLSKLFERHGAKLGDAVPDLSGLPDRPAGLLPEFEAARAALLDQFNGTDWRRQDYGRVIVQDGNLRLAVDPDASAYRVQWIPRFEFLKGGSDSWTTQRRFASVSDVRRWLSDFVGNSHDRDEVPCPDLFAALDGLPELAVNGSWPVLPERPQTVCG